MLRHRLPIDSRVSERRCEEATCFKETVWTRVSSLWSLGFVIPPTMSEDIVMHLSSNSSNPSDPSLPSKLAKLEARMAGKSSTSPAIQSAPAWQSVQSVSSVKLAASEELPESSSESDDDVSSILEYNPLLRNLGFRHLLCCAFWKLSKNWFLLHILWLIVLQQLDLLEK